MSNLRTLLTWIGGVALLAGTLIDSLAVVGRYIGLPLRGSIELMQAMILFAGAAGLVLATIAANHARVRLLVDRLRPRQRAIAERFSDAATALFFACLFIGSGWLAIDLWNGHEMSELLGIPWSLLRFFAGLCLFTCVLVSIRRMLTGGRS